MEAKNGDVARIYALGGLLLLLTAWIYWDYYRPEWKRYQTEFRALVAGRFGADKARLVPTGIQQIWVAELQRADRCVTCHLGVEWEGLEEAPNPYRSHPPAILKEHPISRYGCTLCHGGENYATGLEAAHATAAEHWDEPLLYGALAKTHQVPEPPALLEIHCNLCHRYDRQTAGADYINAAKQLVEENGCSLCHKINGQGGALGPDLSFIGDQSPERYDYSRLPGRASVFGWLVAHFKNPQAIVPETIMPNLNLGDREAQALAMLMMSWRRTNLPAAYIPRARRPDPPAAEASASEPPR